METGMSRQERTAQEIQDEVSRLIHEVQEVREDNATIRVPKPMPLRGTDAAGCNWTMMTFGGDASSYLRAIHGAVGTVMAKWNLKG